MFHCLRGQTYYQTFSQLGVTQIYLLKKVEPDTLYAKKSKLLCTFK